ncbi:MAG: hypothetical protein AAF481_19840 [Acidobacteriota bacterium]
MKRIHLLAVADGEGAETFRPWFAALAGRGLRCGWLDYRGAGSIPLGLEEAAQAGAVRAVDVAEQRTVVVKARKGPAVLEDLLREHFRGCAAVLVRGAEGRVQDRLEALPEGRWRVRSAAGRIFEGSAEELIGRLSRPRPWGSEE